MIFSSKSIKAIMVTIVEGDTKAFFSKATALRSWGGRYTFPWIALLYPYNAAF